MTTSYAVEAVGDMDGNWSRSKLRYPTLESARLAAQDSMAFWSLVREWRVVETSDPPNVEVVVANGRLVSRTPPKDPVL